ncbi:MAG: hypothetical protein N2651_06285 [Fimbriimonadales bacterium]|nr:hypothetical protein [Fimbriimonadales bacterium]
MNKQLRSVGISLALGCAILAGVHAQQMGLDQGWSIGGQALRRGESADFTRYFAAGTHYVIYANGSENASDLDLQILDSRGRAIVEDTRSYKDAGVQFTVSASGQYTIRLKMARAQGRALAYFAVFTVDEGWDVPMRDVSAAFSKLTAITSLAQLADYQIARFYGFIMRVGEVQAITLSGINTGRHAAVAVGDDLADDLDVAVFQNGRLIASDTMVDALPIAEFNSRSGSLEMRVSYESGEGPALVLMALLEKSPSAALSGRTGRL